MSIFKVRLLKGIVTCPVKPAVSVTWESCGRELKDAIRQRFGRSLHVRQVDTGSCGACTSEIISTHNPVYDLQRFGVNFVASPRHADALVVTGPVSRNMALALKRTYEAMPEPKFVIAVGDCARDGGVFRASFYTEGGVHGYPVVLHIPGCPPSPLQIIQALLAFLKNPS